MFKQFIISALSCALICANAHANYSLSSAVEENIKSHVAAKETKIIHAPIKKIKKPSSLISAKNNKYNVIKPTTPSSATQNAHVVQQNLLPQDVNPSHNSILPKNPVPNSGEMTPIINNTPSPLAAPVENNEKNNPLPVTSPQPTISETLPSPVENIHEGNVSNKVIETPVIAQVEAQQDLNVKEPNIKEQKDVKTKNSLFLNYQGEEFELNADLKKQILTFLNNKDQRIRIIGYASNNNDNHQSAARRISLQRVITIRKFLIANNFNSALITVQAMGYVKSDHYPERVEIYVDKD